MDYVEFIKDFLEEVDFSAAEEYILFFAEWLRSFSVKTINSDYLAVLLTFAAKYLHWNDIWVYVSEVLNEWVGF